MPLTKVASAMLNIASYSATNIADKTATVNTTDKYAGLFIWDSTNNRLMRANGSADVSVWWVVDGSVSVTPA
jgi:hypothetical protein